MELAPLSRWIALAYEGVLEPARWNDLLRELAEGLGGHLGLLDVSRPGGGSVVASFGFPDESLRAWEERHAANPWASAARKLRPGEAVCGSALVDPREMRKSSYYDEIMRPLEFEETLGAVVYRSEEVQSHLSVGRRDFFAASEQRQFATVAFHLRQAVRMYGRLRASELRAAVLAGAADLLPVGLGVLDRTGRLVHANQQLAQMLREGDALRDRGGRLGCVSPRAERQLVQLVAAAGARSGSLAGGGLLSVERGPARPGLHVLVAPISGNRAAILPELGDTGEPAVFVLVSDPERSPRDTRHLLRALYSLTSAESQLVAALLEGGSLADYAERAGVTLGTARVRLKRVFEKTGTHRQGELIALVLRSLVALAPA